MQLPAAASGVPVEHVVAPFNEKFVVDAASEENVSELLPMFSSSVFIVDEVLPTAVDENASVGASATSTM